VVITRRTGAPATAQPSDTAEEFAVTGSRSREELTLLAERIHRQRTLYEIEGAFTTCDPVLPSVNDAGDDAGDFDVWSIHTATTVVATIAPHAHAIGLADTADGFGSGAAAKALLVSLGYPAELASALAESWRALGRLRLPFIVRKATLSRCAPSQRYTLPLTSCPRSLSAEIITVVRPSCCAYHTAAAKPSSASHPSDHHSASTCSSTGCTGASFTAPVFVSRSTWRRAVPVMPRANTSRVRGRALRSHSRQRTAMISETRAPVAKATA
jgi:hypothetical protein